MNRKMNILGFTGSLRAASYNRGLLRAAMELMPESAALEVFDLAGIPLFNQDLENTPPEIVKTLKMKIRSSDALLIATPEYNYSVPGVLKNAIDWASRPSGDSAFDKKPVALMSASTGMLGGARAQYHLRQSFVTLNMFPLNKPEVLVSFAAQKFDDKGNLTDEKTKEFVKGLIEALIAWTVKIKNNSMTM
jgi:chromate reductase, NAD(P)H dehydrogenase (quinone)